MLRVTCRRAESATWCASSAGFHILKMVERQSAGVPSRSPRTARHILLRPSAQLSGSRGATGSRDFRRRIQAGTADFAALARENSQDGSADKGGDLGWASRACLCRNSRKS